MGRALAGAFLRAGHPTTVWNRTATRAGALIADGAADAATAADAVAASPLVVVCLRDDAAVQETLDPEALRGWTLVNLTSTAPEQSRRRAEWARDRGIGYLDGTIPTPTPTPTPTIGQPTALVLYSGPEDVYQAHRPVLASLGHRDVPRCGPRPGGGLRHDAARHLLDLGQRPRPPR